MSSPVIKWTKTFDVKHEKGSFRMFVSEHQSERTYATILHFDRRGSFDVLAQEQDKGSIDFKYHTVSGKNEEEAVKFLKDWIDKNLGKKYSVDESK